MLRMLAGELPGCPGPSLLLAKQQVFLRDFVNGKSGRKEKDPARNYRCQLENYSSDQHPLSQTTFVNTFL